MKEHKIVNLIGRPLKLVDDYEEVHIIKPSREHPEPWLWYDQEIDDTVCYNGIEIPVITTYAAEVVDAPPEQDGVLYVVKRAIGDVLRRWDCLSPEQLVRHKKTGQVIGCRALGRFVAPIGDRK